MESKRTQAIQKFNYWAKRMTCPICKSNLSFSHNQVRCDHNHSFDIAKQGYINLAPNHQEAHYNSELFTARQRIMQDANLYAGVYQQILDLLIEKGVDLTQVSNLIDLGTGEGSHLHQLAQTWQAHVANGQDQMPQFLGLDLAKDGVLSAAKHYTNALWMVADLSKLPFKDGQVEGTLTILSPSNYAELNRALSDQGWALKIVPGPNYLKELREIILPVNEQKHDTSASIAKFKAAFNDFGHSHYQQYRPLNKEQLRDLIQMTPLMWHASEDQVTEAMTLDGITIDLQILFGRKKEKA